MFFVHPQIKVRNLIGHVIGHAMSSWTSHVQNVHVQNVRKHFPGKQLIFTDMGRSAFKLIIEKLHLQDSEIIMPAYICDIFAPILEQYNIKPVFVDIDLDTFHIKTEEIIGKITRRTRAILVCHTYGLPFDVDALRSARSDLANIAIIEDCAHAFGIRPKSDIAFFSLYKQFPALRGGLLVCPNDWQVGELPKTSFSFRDFLSLLNCFALFAFLFKKFGGEIAPKIVRKEKLPKPAGLNAVSLALFLRSLENFEKTLESRRKMASFFQEELKRLGFAVQKPENNVFCYLSALVPKHLQDKRDDMVRRLRKYRVFCTRIWHTPIMLDEKEFPNTFEAARRIINFPLQNHYTEKDIKKMIEAIKKVL